jgi:hypothetical protein
MNEFYPWGKTPSWDWDFWPFTGYALIKLTGWDLEGYKSEMKDKMDTKREKYGKKPFNWIK